MPWHHGKLSWDNWHPGSLKCGKELLSVALRFKPSPLPATTAHFGGAAYRVGRPRHPVPPGLQGSNATGGAPTCACDGTLRRAHRDLPPASPVVSEPFSRSSRWAIVSSSVTCRVELHRPRQSHMATSFLMREAHSLPTAPSGSRIPWEPHRPAGPPPPVESISGASRTRHNSSSCSFRTTLFTRQTTLSRIDLDQGNCWRSV